MLYLIYMTPTTKECKKTNVNFEIIKNIWSKVRRTFVRYRYLRYHLTRRSGCLLKWWLWTRHFSFQQLFLKMKIALNLIDNKSCQKTTALAGRQPSLNSSQSFSKVGQSSRSRSQGQKLWYRVKGLVTRNTQVQYESPITSGLKVMAKVKVFQSRSNFKVKVTRSKIMVPCERSCHKKYTYEIWKVYHFWFGSYGQG